MDFIEFPKMARLAREIVITEKIDGTNAAICIEPLDHNVGNLANIVTTVTDSERGEFAVGAQSRSRLITPTDDNFGFAAWVKANAMDLIELGAGTHFGEWWGSGIQRGYGLAKGDKRFSLFNVSRWGEKRPACCSVVPVLYRGAFDMERVENALTELRIYGSQAAPQFMNPEGIVIFHTAANLCFKKTIHKDEVPKALAA